MVRPHLCLGFDNTVWLQMEYRTYKLGRCLLSFPLQQNGLWAFPANKSRKVYPRKTHTHMSPLRIITIHLAQTNDAFKLAKKEVCDTPETLAMGMCPDRIWNQSKGGVLSKNTPPKACPHKNWPKWHTQPPRNAWNPSGTRTYLGLSTS